MRKAGAQTLRRQQDDGLVLGLDGTRSSPRSGKIAASIGRRSEVASTAAATKASHPPEMNLGSLDFWGRPADECDLRRFASIFRAKATRQLLARREVVSEHVEQRPPLAGIDMAGAGLDQGKYLELLCARQSLRDTGQCRPAWSPCFIAWVSASLRSISGSLGCASRSQTRCGGVLSESPASRTRIWARVDPASSRARSAPRTLVLRRHSVVGHPLVGLRRELRDFPSSAARAREPESLTLCR